jgi:hypothetical protein
MILLTTIWIMLFTLRGGSQLPGINADMRRLIAMGRSLCTQGLRDKIFGGRRLVPREHVVSTLGVGEARQAQPAGSDTLSFDFAVLQLPEGPAMTESGSQIEIFEGGASAAS